MAFNTESHSLPTYEKRKKAKLKSGGTKFDAWLKADKIVIFASKGKGYWI